MLVLSRHADESVVFMLDALIPLIESDPQKLKAILASPTEVTLIQIRGDKVRLGIAAAPEIPVHRLEVYEAIQREKKRGTADAR
ncbi:MAG: carbon storage regulator [Planctomycetaceae bacterium]